MITSGERTLLSLSNSITQPRLILADYINNHLLAFNFNAVFAVDLSNGEVTRLTKNGISPSVDFVNAISLTLTDDPNLLLFSSWGRFTSQGAVLVNLTTGEQVTISK